VDNRTEQLADGVWRVEVVTYVNTYLLANDGRGDGEGLTVVDTGTASGGPRLVRSIRMLGFDPRGVSDVLLTHWHVDHTGSAARFATSSAASRVWAGHGDLPVVRGERPPPRPPAPDTTALGRLLNGRLSRPGPPVRGARGLADGDRHEAAGGVEVVATPGHTGGHVAFLLPARGVLLAGDAVFSIGRPSLGPRLLCTALSARPATAARIAALDWELLAVGHGPPLTAAARDRIAHLARRGEPPASGEDAR
jgi:glyoxylase-like metal-dependent hydrolase (beta-lactamase superfamily II)